MASTAAEYPPAHSPLSHGSCSILMTGVSGAYSPIVFSEPGTYVLRAVASDGALFSYENLTVTVTP